MEAPLSQKSMEFPVELFLMINNIIGLDTLIPIINKPLVHLNKRLEGAVTILTNPPMPKMRVTDGEVFHKKSLAVFHGEKLLEQEQNKLVRNSRCKIALHTIPASLNYSSSGCRVITRDPSSSIVTLYETFGSWLAPTKALPWSRSRE